MEFMEVILKNLDIPSKIATVIIATCNLFLTVKFFNFKNTKDNIDKENDRRIQWLKSLILDHNLKHFYEFFDNLNIELNKLKQSGLSNDDKENIDSEIADKFIILRQKFIDIILAVDSNLYFLFITLSDELQAHITDSVFDDGINLSNSTKFDEVIQNKVTQIKTEFIKNLFSYRG